VCEDDAKGGGVAFTVELLMVWGAGVGDDSSLSMIVEEYR
jgi:hypothetical protein